MAEELVLTTPEIIPAKTTTGYRVILLLLDYEQSFINVVVRGTNGEKDSYSYEGDKAANLMRAINKSNNQIKSMHKRILEQLSADGFLVGTVTGTPD